MGLEKILGKKVKNVLDTVYVSLFGNRVAFAGTLLLWNNFEALGIKYENCSEELFAYKIASLAGGLIGLSALGFTNLGVSTLKHYLRASKHIQRRGKLESEYAIQVIEGSENRSFLGYCQQQGLYLAARKHGQLDVFNEAKKSHSKIEIPFF